MAKPDVLGDDVPVDGDLARLLVDGEVDGVGVEARRVKGRVDVRLHALGVVRRRRGDERPVGDESAAGGLGLPRQLGQRHALALAGGHVLVAQLQRASRHGEMRGRLREDLALAARPTAARQALPTAKAVRLPWAPKSNGVEKVSADTTLMSARSTPSSSASTWAAPVRAAVPISAAPVLRATVPSGLIFT